MSNVQQKPLLAKMAFRSDDWVTSYNRKTSIYYTLIIIFLCEVNENAKARKHYEQIAKRLDSVSTATARWSRPWQDEQRGDCT